ncbi:MAG TPA: SGNH/GDSL hydrolase family protein [Bryobacteraceae bacterium]|nr:SGNH/GDSL hydrolase family protein [Bryobacteraceae bacterium]
MHLKTARLFAAIAVISVASQLAAFAEQKANTNRLVVVGDSLAAGFQNFSLFDSSSQAGVPLGGQTQGLGALIARQAGAPATLPLISYPGIPPALELVGGTIQRAAGFGARENPGEQATILAVPGFTLGDALAHPFPGQPATNAIDALADSILGTPAGKTFGCGPLPAFNGYVVSEVACAAALNAKTLIIDIGNNDALQTLTLGAPPTDEKTFAAEFRLIMAALVHDHRATVLVGNIPDVTVVPFLIPRGVFQVQCGFDPGADYVVPNVISPAPGPFNICQKGDFSPRSQAQIDAAHAAVLAYNGIIAQQAAQFGATVVDVYGTLNAIAAHGYDAGGYHLTRAPVPCGGIFSLDSVHPTNTGYAILANAFINVLNSKYKAGIPLVDVNATAATDPLFPPNLGVPVTGCPTP